MSLFSLNRLEEAAEAFEKTVGQAPGYPYGHNNLARAYLGLKRVAEAKEAALEAVRLMPEFAMAHSNLGFCLIGEKKYPEAEKAFSEALRLAPGYGDAHYGRGIAYGGMGKKDKLFVEADILRKIDPEKADRLEAIASGIQ